VRLDITDRDCARRLPATYCIL